MKNVIRGIGSIRGRLCVGTLAAVVILICLASSQAQTPVAPETTNWVASLSAGFSITGGNSDTLQASLGFGAVRLWTNDEFRAGANVIYGENDNDVSTEKATASAQYNHLFTDRFYGLARFDYFHDGVADVFYRFILGAGPGYYLVKDDWTRFNVEVVPSVIFERVPHQVGLNAITGDPHFEHETRGYYLIRFTERLEQKLSATAKCWEQLDYLPPIDDFTGNYLVNGEVGLEVAINPRFALRTVFYWNYDNQPSPHKEANDVAWITSLVYNF